jgi:DNA-binding transcriptional regulator YiaG
MRTDVSTITADEIREIRRRLGLSQTELAERMGLTRDAVANWENGRNSPNGASEVLLRQLESQARSKKIPA